NSGGSENAWIDDLCINDYTLGPIAVTVTPHTATLDECNGLTLNASVAGSPPQYYQWYKNGVAIVGANGSGYTTPPLLRADNGAVYKLVVSNLFSTGNDSATIAVTPDNTAPHLASAAISDPTTVRVKFDKALDPASANTAANYSIGGGITVSGASLQGDGMTVLLSTSPLINGGCYILTANGLTDSCPGNAIAANS